jgi:hypothetical protein
MSAHIDLLDDDGENRAVRSFLMQYSCDRAITVAAMGQHMNRSGWPSEYWPPFARSVDSAGQHLTKAGAQIWIRHLISLEATQPTGQAATAASTPPHCLADPDDMLPPDLMRRNLQSRIAERKATTATVDSWKTVIEAAAALAHLHIENDVEREEMMTHVRRIAAAIPKATTASASGLDWGKCQIYRAPAPSREAEPVSEAAYNAVIETCRGLANALRAARDMVGHPDNIAFIDRALADPAAQAAHAGAEDDTARLDFMAQEECRIEVMAGPRYRLHWPDRGEWQREW